MDTLLFQGLVGRATDEDEPDALDGHTREEVSRGKRYRLVMFRKKLGGIFSALPPPLGGRKEALVLIVVDRW